MHSQPYYVISVDRVGTLDIYGRTVPYRISSRPIHDLQATCARKVDLDSGCRWSRGQQQQTQTGRSIDSTRGAARRVVGLERTKAKAMRELRATVAKHGCICNGSSPPPAA